MEYLPARALPAARRLPSAGARGFTLTELLVTLAVGGILLAVAVPSMTRFLADQAAGGNADEFAEALRFARSEAIKSSRGVQMCPSADGAKCGDDWSKGWIVMAQDSSKVLRVQNALRSMKEVEDGDKTSIVFAATGIATTGAGDYTFTPVGGDSSRARVVNLNVQGRVKVTKGGGS